MPDDLRTEEDVKIKALLPFLRKLGYKDSYCEFDKAIEVQEGRKVKNIFADVVVYTTAKKTAPLILCETKAPSAILDRFVREQAISYARLLPRIAPLVLISAVRGKSRHRTVSLDRSMSYGLFCPGTI